MFGMVRFSSAASHCVAQSMSIAPLILVLIKLNCPFFHSRLDSFVTSNKGKDERFDFHPFADSKQSQTFILSKY